MIATFIQKITSIFRPAIFKGNQIILFQRKCFQHPDYIFYQHALKLLQTCLTLSASQAKIVQQLSNSF